MFCELPCTPELTWWLNLPCYPTPPPASFGRGHSHEWVLKLYHGLLTEMPNNNFEIWRADGQVYCPKSTRATHSYFDSNTVLSDESLYFWELQLHHRGSGGKSCPSLRLVRLKGNYSWGIIINSLAYWCFQRSPFSPPWNRVRMFLVLWFTQLDSNLQHTFAHYAVT